MLDSPPVFRPSAEVERGRFGEAKTGVVEVWLDMRM